MFLDKTLRDQSWPNRSNLISPEIAAFAGVGRSRMGKQQIKKTGKRSPDIDLAVVLEDLRRGVFGDLTRETFVQRSGIPQATFGRVMRGVGSDKANSRMACALGVTMEEVCRCVRDRKELEPLIARARQIRTGAPVPAALDRIVQNESRLCHFWLKSEEKISAVAKTVPEMVSDVLLARTQLDNLSHTHRILVGNFAGELANAVWRLGGPRHEAQIEDMLDTAVLCAGRLLLRHPQAAAAISAKVHNNHLDTGAWCQPFEPLSQKGVEKNLAQFRLAEVNGKIAGDCDPERYGAGGYDTVDHQLSQAYILSLGPPSGWEEAEKMFRDLVEKGEVSEDLRGYAKVFWSRLEDRREKRANAIRLLVEAEAHFTQAVGTDHHLTVCCRTRIRRLDKDTREIRFTPDEDRNLARNSAIKFSDVEDLGGIAALPD